MYMCNLLLDFHNGIECLDNTQGWGEVNMPGKVRDDRIRQDVTDVSSPKQLLCYAMAGQLELLLRRGFTQGRIAQGPAWAATARMPGRPCPGP